MSHPGFGTYKIGDLEGRYFFLAKEDHSAKLKITFQGGF